jgi:uncharacterized protein (TIRG00374 family)
VGQVLRGARAAWIIAIVVVSVGTVYIRAQRWRVLLRPVGDVPLYPALSATAIGFGASAVLPFRVGELLRPALLGRRVGVALSAALSSVVLERLFDMLLVISCFLVVSLMWPVPGALRRGAWVLAGVAVLGFAALMVVQRRRATSQALLERVLRYLPAGAARGLRSLAGSFLDGLGGLSDGRAVVLVLGYSAYLWAVITLTFMFGFLALEIDVPLFAASLATVVIVAAFVFLPQAPGFIGTWQAGCVLSLGLFGVSQETALGYSLLTWIIQMSTNIATAGFFLAREGMSVGQLMRVAPPE